VDLGCSSFEDYPRKVGISITTKYLITDNTKKFINGIISAVKRIEFF
jgi:hypothetical protein